MGCHAACEDMEEDEQEFLAAAEEDAALVANLLIRLSRSETCVPWRQLREPTPQAATPPPTEGEDAAPALRERPEWGTRRARSRCITMEGIRETKEEEAARRASPTTPLSWSGGSWTSGSVSESAPSRPSKRRQTPDSAPGQKVAAAAASLHDLEPAPVKRAKPGPHESRGQGQGLAPACKWRKTEAACKQREPHSVLVPGEPAAVGSSSGSGSGKAVVASALPVRGAPGPGAHVEPLRLAGEGTSSVVVRRPGKKKTVPELKALELSLLQEQEELRKELEQQKKIYEALSEENMKLKSLEACRTADEPTVAPPVREEAASEEPQRPQTEKGQSTAAEPPTQLLCTSPSTSVPQRSPLFDLNCQPDDDDLL